MSTQYFNPPMELRAADLQLGDRVLPVWNAGLDVGKSSYVVQQIKKDTVHLQRPYISTTDFSTGGEGHSEIIVYTGIEHFPVLKTDKLIFRVFERHEIK